MKIISILKESNPKELGGVETFNRMLKNFFKKELFFFARPLKGKAYFKVDNIIEFKIDNFYDKILKSLFGKSFLISKKLRKEKADIYILNLFTDLKYIKKIDKPCILVQHMNFENYFGNTIKNKKIEFCKKN